MNTHSQKKLATQNPMNPQFGQGDINSQRYFFTLSNTIDLNHEDLVNHKRAKRNIVRQRQFKRDMDRAEKLV